VAASLHHPLAWLLSLYGPSDQAYFESPSPVALGFEGFNVVVTTPLSVLLAYGVVRRRAWRWPLQLGISAYVVYSVVLYFLIAQISGFAGMPVHTARAFAIFYGANLPWLVGYAWLGWEAAREIGLRLLHSAPTIVKRDRVAPVVEKIGEQAAEVEARRERGDDRERAESLAP
jgi:EXPERA (EXPanded EBP superfamily)